MKSKPSLNLPCFCILHSAFCLSAFAQATAFTYQGRLNDGGNPAAGIYDLRFTIYDSTNNPGTVIAGPLTNAATVLSNGLFSVTLDFGPGVFTGPDRWLDIGVRTNGPGAFSVLAPRQLITPAPYAIMANNASNLLGVLPAAQLSGAVGNGQLVNSSITVGAGTGLSGGGAVALGGSTTLSNAGVLSVTGNADILASTLGGAVTLSTTATNANVAGRIVKRDGSGSFSAGSITLNNNLTLPPTIVSAGIIFSGGNTLLHTFGSQNTFAGVAAGNLTLSGNQNSGFGFNALLRNTTGIRNTASGAFAMAFNTTGGDNVAYGIAALELNTNGIRNTAVGAQALLNNTSGNENTANGANALFANRDGSYNTAGGSFAMQANKDGSWNTAYGYFALNANTNGTDNTAVGAYALMSNTSGGFNTACGDQALISNTDGFDNTAVGESAMFFNTVGSHNTAIGYQALTSNTNGTYNTAIGESALNHNLSGFDNNAWGASSMNRNVSGDNNLAAGYQTLYNNTNGSFNTAVGNDAMLGSFTGSQNTAIGAFALSSCASFNNIALGYSAGQSVTTGGTNIHIGHFGVSSDTNVIRIGTSQARTFIAGIFGATVAGSTVVVNSSGQLGVAVSSARFKDDIHSMGNASDVLLALKPVTFRYKPDIDPGGVPQFGLIAEEVDKVDPDLVVRDDQRQIFSVRYEAVNAMLLNEFLKQHRTVEEQSAEIQALKRRLAKLEQLIDQTNGGAKRKTD